MLIEDLQFIRLVKSDFILSNQKSKDKILKCD